jgi:negative regulator of sigma E activity
MDCNYTEKISALIDGELSPVETNELELHVLSCAACREAKADFLSLRSQINDFPVSFEPVAQREALARILGKNKGVASGPGWRWVFNPAVAGVAAMLIVAVVIGLLLYPRTKPTTQTPEEVVADNQRKKPAPTPTSSPAEGAKDRNTPTPRTTPSGDKNKTPNKKRPQVIVEPPEDNIAKNDPPSVEPEPAKVRAADTETMTAIHFQKSELLLRSFRNVRANKPNSSAELSYEKRLAQQLVYQNMMLRREADASGDAQVASLLESLEPILLDIANLPDKPANNEVKVIKDRVERKNIVALLQVNSTALARALD